MLQPYGRFKKVKQIIEYIIDTVTATRLQRFYDGATGITNYTQSSR